MEEYYGNLCVFDAIEWKDNHAFEIHTHSYEDPELTITRRLYWNNGRVTLKENIQEGDWNDIGAAKDREECKKLAIAKLALWQPGNPLPPPQPTPEYIISYGNKYTWPEWDTDGKTFRIWMETSYRLGHQKIGPFIFQWDGQEVRLLVKGSPDDARSVGQAASRKEANKAAANFLLRAYETGHTKFDPLTGEAY